MPETVRIEDVAKMLDIAKFHLQCFKSEHLKKRERNTFAMEAYMLACIHVGSGVFYALTNPNKNIVNPFADKAEGWKTDLRNGRKAEYAFFFRMLDRHRGLAVHVSTMPTTVGESAITAHVHPDLQGWGIHSDPGTVIVNKLRLDDGDAIPACDKYLALLDELVQYCSAPLKE